MTQTSKNIPSLHKFVERASINAVLMLLRSVSKLAGQPWMATSGTPAVDPLGAEARGETRRELLNGCRQLPAELRLRLDGDARRIIVMSEDKGLAAIKVVEPQLYRFDDKDGSLRRSFDEQSDDFGRATVLFVQAHALFEDAECYFHAEHHRNFGRLYEVYEIDFDEVIEFVWDDPRKAAFESKIKQLLGLPGSCLVQHLPFEQGYPESAKRMVHMFLIRHMGAISSVQDTQADFSLRQIAYRPPVEATLLFQPDQRQVEVFSHEASERLLIAAAFAETCPGADLSRRPVSLRQYNLARFYQSLRLPPEPVGKLDLLDVRVVEAEARPQNFKRRVFVRVGKEDDIEQAVRDMLGDNSIFTRAALISRVVLNLRFRRDGKVVNLPITLSAPNRSNHGSRRDPHDRELGLAVLEAYGIARTVAPLSAAEEAGQFRVMLQLYEGDFSEVRKTQLVSWGADTEILLSGGFLVPKAAASDVTRVRDDGTVVILPVRSLGSRLVANDPDSGDMVDVDADELARFEVRRAWVTERVAKGLRGVMRMGRGLRQDAAVVKLGTLVVGNDDVPVHLARRLDRLDVVAEVDRHLRGDGQVGYGVVLTATEHAPEFLGANVVVPLGDVLVLSDTGVSIDQPRLLQILRDGRQRALAATVVDLRITNDTLGKETGTLTIPGKPPFSLSGYRQVQFVQRLVEAHRCGSPVVAARALFDGMGSDHPAQLFKGDIWKDYVGHPPSKTRGWSLLL